MNGRTVLLVVKYGGHAIAAGAGDPVLDECAARFADGDRIVIVHGGAPQIDAAARRQALVERRIAGLRVTDPATLEVVEAVLCGTVNKALVRALLARGARAAGLCGQDGALLRARRIAGPLGEDLGAVGEIEHVDARILNALLAGGFLPVVAPLALDGASGEPLNVNADTSAGAIAAALAADAYVVVTAVPRVLRARDDPRSGIDRLERGAAERGLANGAFDGGMGPKIRSALQALEGGVGRAVICGTSQAPIAGALRGEGTEVF